MVIKKNKSPSNLKEKLDYKFDTEIKYNDVTNCIYKIKADLFGKPSEDC